MKLEIFFDRPHQTLEGFGVSGAWWAQEVGAMTAADPVSGLPVRERAARLLFSPDEGIGITRYRYNIGAGSKESGKGKFEQENRRAACLETAPERYELSRDAAAVWMLRAAVRLGADDVTAFVNSPPERLTKNGKAHLDRPLRTNLRRRDRDAFARYALGIVALLRREGIPVRAISPVNEPVWVWTGSQEGCHYRPRQVRGVMRAFAERLAADPALRGVRLAGAENGDIRWFNKTYSRIMCGKKLLPFTDGVDVHSYFLPVPEFLPAPLRRALNDREAYMRRWRRWMTRRFPSAKIRVSEWCHMCGGRDLGMDSALAQAKVTARDLTLLDAAAWELWIAMSNYDYCDGLIYYDETGALTIPKRYYAFGNFSKFIRPGAVRLETAGESPGTAAVAFRQGGDVALALLNETEDAVPVRTALDGAGTLWITDGENDLAPHPVPDRAAFTLPPRSVCTLTAG